MNKLEEKLWSMKTANRKGVEEIQSLFTPVNLRKGLIIGSPDYSSPILHFIEEGLVMGYSIIDGVDHPSWLAEQGFIPPIGGFFSKQPLEEFVQVLENTKVWYLNLTKTESQAQKNNDLYRMLLEIFEENLQLTRQREMFLRIPSAKNRFSKLIHCHKPYIYKVNNEILAALLNVSKNHLIKIKSLHAKSHLDY